MTGPYCDVHEQMAKEVHDIHECLLGPDNSDQAQGLRAQVSRHQSVINAITRTLWLAVGAGVVAVVGLIIRALPG